MSLSLCAATFWLTAPKRILGRDRRAKRGRVIEVVFAIFIQPLSLTVNKRLELAILARDVFSVSGDDITNPSVESAPFTFSYLGVNCPVM